MKHLRENIGKVFSFRVTGSITGTVWGGANGIYTDDSKLAAAAVHAGVLKPGEEAIIKVRILGAQKSFTGIKRNGVVSNDFGAWDGSFSFIK